MKNIKNVKHIDKLKSLGYSLNEMLIVGSGTMALYGLKENNDIDLWVSKKVLSKMKNDKRFTKNVKNFWQAYDGLIEAEGILICSTGNFEENIKRATIVNGFHFQSLQDVLDWKKCMNRPKDHEHIKMIEAYMIPYKVNKSKISGKGIFATRDIEKDENLGIAFIKVSNTGIPDKDFKRTELGTFVNHSDKPNLKVEKTNKEYLYIALKNIKNGEELTVDYKKFDFEGERGFLENGLISLDKFDEKFLKTIKDWENIGYAPEKWPGKWYTIIYNEQKAGITGAVIINDSHFFQIAIHPNFRGMGLLKSSADLLAKKLNIKKLYATVWLDNKASYKSHINAGFKEMPKDRIEYLKKIGKLENGSTRLYKDFSDHSVVENYLQIIQEGITYSSDISLVYKIIDTFTEKERNKFMGPREWWDDCQYRKVLILDGVPIAYLEARIHEGRAKLNFGVNIKYRRKNYLTTIFKKAIIDLKKIRVSKLLAEVDKDNIKSNNLIKKMGFKEMIDPKKKKEWWGFINKESNYYELDL